MTPQAKGLNIPWHFLGSAWLLAFAMTAPMFCIPPIEHILKESLLLTHTQASLLFSIPILMLVILAIPGGILVDRIGTKNAAGIGAIIIAVGTMLRATATDAPGVIAFTFIYGIGYGLTFPNLPKLVSAWCPREKASIATGIFVTGLLTGVALATAITVPVVLPVTNTLQGVFFIWSIPPIVAAILWWAVVREPVQKSISTEPTITYRTQLRQVLTNKSLWLVAIFLLIHNSFFFNWLSWAPSLMMLKGATPRLAGFIASATAWVPIPALFIIPGIAYRIGLNKPFIWGTSIITALLAWGALYADLTMSWLIMALMGTANAARFTFVMALPVEITSRKNVGAASGLVLSVGFIGGLVGPLIGGRILDITGSLNISLLALIGISIVLFFLALRLPETGPKAKRNKEKQ